jgi:hypothetical protein
VGRRAVAAAVVLAVVGATAGYAAGRTLAPGPQATTRPEEKALAATGGPGFPPAVGWNTAQTTAPALYDAPSALSATVPLADAPGQNPERTLAALGRDDVLIQTSLYGRAGFRPKLDERFPARTLPLQPDQADAQHEWEGGHGLRYSITGRVDGWLVEAIAYFGTTTPSEATRRLADDQLARLILPDPCPAGAQPLGAAALDDAEKTVRAILFRGDGKPTLTARAATADDAVPGACGDVPRDRIAVVDVSFAGPGKPQTYLTSVQNGREVVWARVR